MTELRNTFDAIYGPFMLLIHILQVCIEILVTRDQCPRLIIDNPYCTRLY